MNSKMPVLIAAIACLAAMSPVWAQSAQTTVFPPLQLDEATACPVGQEAYISYNNGRPVTHCLTGQQLLSNTLGTCASGANVVMLPSGQFGCTNPVQVGAPLYAIGVNINNVTTYNAIIANEINREGVTGGVAAGWMNDCIITDPSNNSGSMTAVLSGTDSGTCRNLICTGTDPAHRWSMLNSTRGWCEQGHPYSDCPAGTFSVNIGCMFVQQESDINLP